MCHRCRYEWALDRFRQRLKTVYSLLTVDVKVERARVDGRGVGFAERNGEGFVVATTEEEYLSFYMPTSPTRQFLSRTTDSTVY